MNPLTFTESINKKFSISPPIFLSPYEEMVKLELKSYLQPFEKDLALRELKSLLLKNDRLIEKYGYFLVKTERPDDYLRQRLTYWQRVGRSFLEPTVQKSLEFTQNGIEETRLKNNLHNARRLRYGPHDLHEYRGKFFPQLVRSLINISGIPNTATVLDPMCGSGTTPCEAIASGRSAISADLNPLSILISKVKSGLVFKDPISFFDTSSGYLDGFKFKSHSKEHIWGEDDLRYLSLWFDEAAINDISIILSSIDKIKDEFYQSFFKVCLSNIIRSVSWQKDTDLRVRKEKKEYINGSAIKDFKRESIRQIDRIYAYLCVLPKNIEAAPSLDIRIGNAVSIDKIFPEYINKVDLLVTSPPYATALPYLDTDRLSLIALGLLPRKQHKDYEVMMVGTREVSERQRREKWDYYLTRKSELPSSISSLIESIGKVNHREGVGFRRRNLPALLGLYFLNMLDAMTSAHHLMIKGAKGYYVVGNNSTLIDDEKLEIPTDRFLFELAAVAGWKPIEMISMELLHSRDIFKENRGSAEAILCLEA